MKKEFNLSEKIIKRFDGFERDNITEVINGFISEEDVKEFIRRLKDGCKKEFGDSYYKDMALSVCGKITNGELRYCSECRKWVDKIDKLAGENLIDKSKENHDGNK